MAKLDLSWDLLKKRRDPNAQDDWEDLKYDPGSKRSAFADI